MHPDSGKRAINTDRIKRSIAALIATPWYILEKGLICLIYLFNLFILFVCLIYLFYLFYLIYLFLFILFILLALCI